MVQTNLVTKKLREFRCPQVVEFEVEIETGDGCAGFFFTGEVFFEVRMSKGLVNSDPMVGVVVEHTSDQVHAERVSESEFFMQSL